MKQENESGKAMTAKHERGANVDPRRTIGLQTSTVGYSMLQRIYERGTVKPADLHNLMPARRQNTATVFIYLERLANLRYVSTNHCDEISITKAGREFIEGKQEEPSGKYRGTPAAPRVVNIWTKPMTGYDALMRAGRRVA